MYLFSTGVFSDSSVVRLLRLGLATGTALVSTQVVGDELTWSPPIDELLVAPVSEDAWLTLLLLRMGSSNKWQLLFALEALIRYLTLLSCRLAFILLVRCVKRLGR